MKPLFILLVSAALAQQPSLVREVRAAAASGDFASAQKTLDSAKLTSGISPRWL
ncbi:MAG: hypothetical protein HZB13_08175, partial [Acidobacteria bacterium]|nr:hypothetical protein [Acidobacteriota bacterium]